MNVSKQKQITQSMPYDKAEIQNFHTDNEMNDQKNRQRSQSKQKKVAFKFEDDFNYRSKSSISNLSHNDDLQRKDNSANSFSTSPLLHQKFKL